MTDIISIDYLLANRYDFLVSYGYRHILKKSVLDFFPNKAINLHISYLPYNRGADPNFWSFIEDTPKGVTIHYLDEGVDTGDIIIQKEHIFDLIDEETLISTYQKLHAEIQKLFYQQWSLFKTQKSLRTPQSGSGTSHKLKDKEYLMHLIKKEGWDTKISKLTSL